MKIVFIHRKNTTNIGDLAACPASYLEFPTHTRTDPFNHTGTCDLMIIGGGGLMQGFFDDQMRKIVKTAGAVVLWGVGSHYKTFRMADWAENADMIGIRDKDCGYDLVPCASCLSIDFDQTLPAIYPSVGYYHSHKDWRPRGMPVGHNHDTSLRNAVNFLATGKKIHTNSYHGAYWGKLLDREVALSENWNSKFDHLPETTLQEARRLNLEFYRKVQTRFNLSVDE